MHDGLLELLPGVYQANSYQDCVSSSLKVQLQTTGLFKYLFFSRLVQISGDEAKKILGQSTILFLILIIVTESSFGSVFDLESES